MSNSAIGNNMRDANRDHNKLRYSVLSSAVKLTPPCTIWQDVAPISCNSFLSSSSSPRGQLENNAFIQYHNLIKLSLIIYRFVDLT